MDWKQEGVVGASGALDAARAQAQVDHRANVRSHAAGGRGVGHGVLRLLHASAGITRVP